MLPANRENRRYTKRFPRLSGGNVLMAMQNVSRHTYNIVSRGGKCDHYIVHWCVVVMLHF